MNAQDDAELAAAILECLVVTEDDNTVKDLIVRAGAPIPEASNLRGPQDVCILPIHVDGFEFWTFRFFEEGDSGYTAYGFPIALPEHVKKELRLFIIQCFMQGAIEQGADPLTYLDVIEFGKTEAN